MYWFLFFIIVCICVVLTQFVHLDYGDRIMQITPRKHAKEMADVSNSMYEAIKHIYPKPHILQNSEFESFKFEEFYVDMPNKVAQSGRHLLSNFTDLPNVDTSMCKDTIHDVQSQFVSPANPTDTDPAFEGID